jgi:putative transposase
MAITRPNQDWSMSRQCKCIALTLPASPMARGFAYLAVVLDWATRRVLSWRL